MRRRFVTQRLPRLPRILGGIVAEPLDKNIYGLKVVYVFPLAENSYQL